MGRDRTEHSARLQDAMNLLQSRGRDSGRLARHQYSLQTALHVELDFNRCFHFHRFAVQDVRFVLPLFHGIHRSLDENWMPLDRTKVFDDSTLTYGRLQQNVTLNVRNPGHLWIRRLDVMNFKTICDA
jgi:hypothetical protein